MSVPDTPAAAPRTRPGVVTAAVWLQILLAVFITAQSVAGLVYGADVQDAAEAELADQGYTTGDLPQGYTFESGGAAALAPVVVAVGLLVLALLNGAGKRPARIITWVVQPLVLVCGGFLFVSQALFAAPLLEAAIESEGGPADLDAQALFDAVAGAYPMWANLASWGAVAFATLGSIAVIVLLAVPAANAFFRKPEAGPAFIPGAPDQ